MSEKEIKQLIKLLDKYRSNQHPDEKLNPRESSIISAVRTWVVWYGRDSLGMEIR